MPTAQTAVCLDGVKKKLVGLDNWLLGAAHSGAAYTDAHITNKVIPAQIRKFERESTLRINPIQVISTTRDDGAYSGLQAGTLSITGGVNVVGVNTQFASAFSAGQTLLVYGKTYTVLSVTDNTHMTLATGSNAPPVVNVPFYNASLIATDAYGNPLPLVPRDGLTYNQEDADEYFRFHLHERPILSVQRCRMMLGNQTVFEVPASWISIEQRTDTFTIAPVSGTLLIQAVTAFAQIQMAFAGKTYLPNAVHFDYQAGLPIGWQDQVEYADLLRALEEYCALAVLTDISELADAGLLNVSMNVDGVSEVYNYSRFKQRKDELNASATSLKELMKNQETPVLMTWV